MKKISRSIKILFALFAAFLIAADICFCTEKMLPFILCLTAAVICAFIMAAMNTEPADRITTRNIDNKENNYDKYNSDEHK